ncbi:hypothetical protein PTKIN_Ptkin16aG0027700 [Pterospermum kingtungense]
MGIQKDVAKFNVGGRIFETTATTLAKAGRDSFFGALFDDNWDLQQQQNNQQEIFIDRNPECFAVLLDLLRTDYLDIPDNVPRKLLYKEAMFYGLMDHVRSANCNIKFNVGGRIFETTAKTLAKAGRDSVLGALIFDDNDNWDLITDRDPDCFAVLLNLLRTGDLYIPDNVPERLLYREAIFYGLVDHVRSAMWDPLDGNRLKLSKSQSVTRYGAATRTAIRAGQAGGCCVADGRMVRVFDGMLEEQPPINLDYQDVNDMGWINAENVLVSACEGPREGEGGIGLFSSSTGDLKHKFNVVHDNQVKGYTGGGLSFSPDYKIFASCKGKIYNEYGIGVWDQITGKQIDFFYETSLRPRRSLGDAGKLQWLNGSNCLLVSTFFLEDTCYMSLLDFRQKKTVWSWSDITENNERRVRDVIAIEECNSVCAVNKSEDLGFLDLRTGAGRMRWRRMEKWTSTSKACYPKLALHNGQLFLSMHDSISVYCGPHWVLTSRLRTSNGGLVCDFSIGGDRLFVLHGRENTFDVWETPPLLRRAGHGLIDDCSGLSI